jgi:hypothetical protein
VPYSVAIGDLNGDGNPDLAVANMGSNTVSVLLGTGTGNFGAKTDFATGNGPYSVAIGDVSGDGKLDLVTANNSSSTVSVLLGTGTGSFGAKTDFATGAGTVFVAIGDLNGDGKPDLAVANFYSNTVSVLLGTGTGSFGVKTDFASGTNPASVAIADLNGDGKPDLAVANFGSNAASVLLGTGTGSFGAKTDFATGGAPYWVAIRDLNGDGKPDLTVANRGSGTVSVLLALESTQAVLVSAPNPSTTGGAVNLTATVTAVPPITGTPSGTVSFFDGFTLLGTQTLSGGTATLTAFPAALGNHPLTAVYGGSSQLLGRISAPLIQTVNPLSGSPVITRVRDVPNDQGGKVKVSWNASPLDAPPDYAIASYWILRSVPPNLMAAALTRGARLLAGPEEQPIVGTRSFIVTRLGAVEYAWEYVGSQVAFHTSSYSYLAPTAGDSVAGSNPLTAFMIQARNGDGSEWWFSEPDSGYSVDNLAPPAPAPFTGQYATGTATLHWGVSGATDFATFRLYRGSEPDFVPGPGSLVTAQSDTGYVDPAGSPCYYKLSAVDIHGNEGPVATLLPSGTVEVAQSGPLAFALEGVRPNPSHGEQLSVAFTLPTSAPALLELVDVSGRRVVEREAGSLGVGRHVVDLAAGRRIAPGLYLVRLTQGASVRVTRVTVLR